MPTERVTFAGPGGHTLAARLEQPGGPVLATAVFAHCFTCTKDSLAATRISRRLAAAGIAVLRFDFSGVGQSEGAFEETTFSSNVDDLVAANEYMAERGMTPSLLVGHSLGGTAVLAAAHRLPHIRAIATIGAPASPLSVTRQFEDALPEIRENGEAEVLIGDHAIRIGADFVRDVESTTLKDKISDLDKALLVLHAPLDEVVPLSNATEIFKYARHPKSYVTLDTADHLLTDPRDAEYAAGMITAWAERYLDLRPPAPPIGAPEGIIRVSEADPSGFLNDVQAGPRHHVLADEPEAYGGTDQGMSPYGFLSAGLGACTSMTIRMYARRKNWPLRHIRVDVRHDKVHAQDASMPTMPHKGVDRFIREITLLGDLTEDQRDRLLQIADKCPVHDTLKQTSVVETHLLEK